MDCHFTAPAVSLKVPLGCFHLVSWGLWSAALHPPSAPLTTVALCWLSLLSHVLAGLSRVTVFLLRALSRPPGLISTVRLSASLQVPHLVPGDPLF